MSEATCTAVDVTSVTLPILTPSDLDDWSQPDDPVARAYRNDHYEPANTRWGYEVQSPVLPYDGRTTEELADLANDYLQESRTQIVKAVQAVRRSLLCAKKCGDALRAAKSRVGHGHWTAWLKENFDGSEETARKYMRITAYWKHYVIPFLKSRPKAGIEQVSAAIAVLRSGPNHLECQNYIHVTAEGVADIAKQNEDMKALRKHMGEQFDDFMSRLDDYHLVLLANEWPEVVWQMGCVLGLQ